MTALTNSSQDISFVTSTTKLRYSSILPFSPVPPRDAHSSSLLLTPHKEPKDSKNVSPTHESIYSIGLKQRRLLYTALHQSILDGRLHQTELLVKRCGADVNVQDVFRRTPSMLCSLIDDEALSMRLMRVLCYRDQLRLDIRDNLGRTALAYACIHGRAELCQFFLSQECDDFGDGDNDKNTPLHHAARQGNTKIVEMLIKAYQRVNMDVDKRNNLGYTALLISFKEMMMEAAALLLVVGGAVASVRDNEFFLNAQEWYEKVLALEEKRKQDSSKSRRPLTERQVAMQVRPAFLSDRAHTTMGSFYRNLVNPALKEVMLQNDYQSFTGIPQIPSSSREITKIHLEDAISVAPEDMDSDTPRMNVTGEARISADDLRSMSSAEIHRIIKRYIHPLPLALEKQPVTKEATKKPPRLLTIQLGKQNDQSKVVESRPKTRPNTANLIKYRVPSSCSSTETVRRLLTLYSHAVTAPPSAQKEVIKKPEHFQRKASMMRYGRLSLLTNTMGPDDRRSTLLSSNGPLIEEKKSPGGRF